MSRKTFADDNTDKSNKSKLQRLSALVPEKGVSANSSYFSKPITPLEYSDRQKSGEVQTVSSKVKQDYLLNLGDCQTLEEEPRVEANRDISGIVLEYADNQMKRACS